MTPWTCVIATSSKGISRQRTRVARGFLHTRLDALLERLFTSASGKADGQGRFTAESVYLEWRDQCFGQKREPSPWLTFIVDRILSRRPQNRGGVT